MEQLGAELLRCGYEVTVLTMRLPNRTANEFNGIKIESEELPSLPLAIARAVSSEAFACCILVQDPLGTIIWSLENLPRPKSTRVIVQPIINEEGYARWKDDKEFCRRLAAILKGHGHVLAMTQTGPDVRFMRQANVKFDYLPNASHYTEATDSFRERFNLPQEAFVILHVANLYWVKNHIGLLETLHTLPTHWRLVMVGHPGQQDCTEAVMAKIQGRNDLLYIPGLSREWIAAAMEEADVLVLSSKGEGSPITLLEAMSHGKPWLATPQCGAANDHAGGVVTELVNFKKYLRVLFDNPELRQGLGKIGLEHWQQGYSWPVVIRGWVDLIEHGRLQRSFGMSGKLKDKMKVIRKQLAAKLPQGEEYAGDRDGVLQLVSEAERLVGNGELEIAAQCYGKWLENHYSTSPLAYVVCFNLGILLEQQNDPLGAAEAYQRALDRQADFAPAQAKLNNLPTDKKVATPSALTTSNDQHNMLDIYCINMDHRTDRWNESLANYAAHGLDPAAVRRWSAVSEPEFGSLGCAKSHVIVLADFLARGKAPYCLVLEDDFDFVRPWGEFVEQFNRFTQKGMDWDVILLNGTYVLPYKTLEQGITRIWRSHSTAAYLVSRRYASALLGCFAEGVSRLEEMRHPDFRTTAIKTLSIDVLWQVLQRRDHWYIFTPSFGRQRPSFSDIEQQVTSYDHLTYGLKR